MKTRHLDETFLDITASSCSTSLDVCGISALIVVARDRSPPFGLKDDASHGQLQPITTHSKSALLSIVSVRFSLVSIVRFSVCQAIVVVYFKHESLYCDCIVCLHGWRY